MLLCIMLSHSILQHVISQHSIVMMLYYITLHHIVAYYLAILRAATAAQSIRLCLGKLPSTVQVYRCRYGSRYGTRSIHELGIWISEASIQLRAFSCLICTQDSRVSISNRQLRIVCKTSEDKLPTSSSRFVRTLD